MLKNLRSLAPALALVALAAAALLLSDLKARQRGAATGRAGLDAPMPRLAILQHSSTPIMEAIRAGANRALTEAGFIPSVNIIIDVMNPQGDLPTANTMAQRIAALDYDAVFSISTPMLQAMAGANRRAHRHHILAGVSDPVAAGVGIKMLDSTAQEAKPAWLTGIGTAQPVEAIFRLAREINPDLRVVGVVWNPAEVNSEVCTRRARVIASELGIELLEAPIEKTGDVPDAANALVQRGAEAFWTGGDATVAGAIGALVAAARRGSVPVFSNMAGQVDDGTLFDFGADYESVGYEGGRVVAQVLRGTDPATLPVRDYMPARLLLNERALQGLSGNWIFPAAMVQRAASKIENKATATAVAPRASVGTARNDPAGHLLVVVYIESPPIEEALAGFAETMKASGSPATWTIKSAQGDMATLASIIDAVSGEDASIVVPFSTPALQTAAARLRGLPIVFSVVADPVLAGVAKADGSHLPNVTGVQVLGGYADMAELLARDFPSWKRIGTTFAPAEVNSVANLENFRKELAARGISIETMAAATAGDLPDAVLALGTKSIDAIVQIDDNQSSGGFPAIARAAARARMPLFAFTRDAVLQGAALSIGLDYHEAGRLAAELVLRVLRGEDPGLIPIRGLATRNLWLSPENARKQGLKIPASLLARARLVDPGKATERGGR